MTVKEILDGIELQSRHPVTRSNLVDRVLLLTYLSEEINEILSRVDIPSLVRHLDPIIDTQVGVRSYLLPEDFPENFLKGSSDRLDEDYAVRLVNSSNAEANLEYKDPAQFLSEHDSDEDNSNPDDFTIMTGEGGRKEIWLGPAPDADTYTIRGTYKPLYWRAQEKDNASMFPPTLLRYAVLRRLQPNNEFFHTQYDGLLQSFIVGSANRVQVSVNHAY